MRERLCYWLASPGPPLNGLSSTPGKAQPGSAELVHLDSELCKAQPAPALTMLLAYALLDQVAATEKDNIEVLDLLARRGLEDGLHPASAEAIRDLARHIQLGSTWPPDYHLLGHLLAPGEPVHRGDQHPGAWDCPGSLH